MNKTYRGMGWWAGGFALVAVGFVFALLRDVVEIGLISIIIQNTLLILGATLIYVGSLRFLDKKENRGIVVSILAVFILSTFYVIYVNRDDNARTMILYVALAIISLLTAQGLLVNKTRSIAASANFLSAVFLAHGGFFAFRVVVTLTVVPINSFFTPTLMQTATFLVQLVEGILLTFGFIIMVNQRLNAEMREAKEHFEAIFNTSPDAALITRLN
ncbi:MAG: sensor domain-containing diguanylate cyclase, partial [Candidatus Atribacteria bacterium]|nr:sensor domain-containing diguanylate cyclase [Candidatus Atribacteria bacterium]